jgi:transposase
MKSSEQLKLDVISKLSLGKFSKEQAQQILSVSERSIDRYLAAYKKYGVTFVNHKNKQKNPSNKLSNEIKKKAVRLVREQYFDFNMTHCLEKLKENHDITINRETFRKWCHGIGMVKKAKSRRGKVRTRRDRMEQSGLMLQMDGSPHRWFGGKESCLIGAIDDATSEVPFAEFFPAEDTLSCMTVLQRIIETKGTFHILYTDRAGIFGGPKRANFSQVKRALEELNIRIIFANSAEAKGRVERLWQTLQDRLIPEMRIRNIRSYEAANYFLQEQYLPNEYSKKFQVVPKNLETAYRKAPEGLDLNQIFCIKESRSVKRDHTLSWNGELYKIKSPLKYSIHKQKIEFRTYQDLSSKAFFANKEIALKLVVKPEKDISSSKENIKQIGGLNVRKDGHVNFGDHYYSVNENYIGKDVVAKEKMDRIYLYYYGKVIEVHNKVKISGILNATKPDHMGPWNETIKESSFLRTAARRVGTAVEEFVVIVLNIHKGFVHTNHTWGIITLKNIYKEEHINLACQFALDIESINYRTVKTFLNLKYKQKNEVRKP